MSKDDTVTYTHMIGVLNFLEEGDDYRGTFLIFFSH